MQNEHRRLWLLRNISGRLERSMKLFENLEIQIRDLLKTEQGGSFGKAVNRCKEKVIAARGIWYLED